jgi:peptide/nickel transport system permease protein
MFTEILPNALPPMLISFFGGMAATVLGIAGLAFLGLGDPFVANWGQDIYWSDIYHFSAFLWPGIVTAVFAIGAMLIGDGLRDALDPRLQLKKKRN